MSIQFRPQQIDPSVFIAPGAVVIGDVTIGERSSVWFNAVIRGDVAAIRIGRRTNVQDGCVLHADLDVPCVLGDNVTLGHHAIVHGAEVGDNVLVGMNAVVMNHCKIGENSIIGVGAVLTEGLVVPPGSLVLGLPAKVRGSLSAEQIEQIRHAADHYVENARRYLEASRAT
jgi:gamma-carbonic anhydrase